MNGPFAVVEWCAGVVDANGERIVNGEGHDDDQERKNAEMACAALNAVYYAAKATGEQA